MRKPPIPAAQRRLQTSERPGPVGKSRGQHFLIDTEVAERIFSALELNPTDTIVEVGPGGGALTRSLVKLAGKVIAIEIDPHLVLSLRLRLRDYPNLSIITQDARSVNLGEILEGEVTYKMVGNLPYYAAVPILRRFLELEERRPTTMVFMVQEEVARSMVAEDGRMSLLAVGVQSYGEPRIICTVPPGSFRPSPKVSSAVVSLNPRLHQAIDFEQVDEFFSVVRAGFFAPRKQIRNSLSRGMGLPPDEAGRLLEEAGINPGSRPANLSIADWWTLYQAGKETWPLGSQSLRQNKSDAGGLGSSF